MLIITGAGLSLYFFPFSLSFPFRDSTTPSLSNAFFFYVYVGKNMHPMASVCQWKGNLWGQFLCFFFRLGFQDQIQVARLSDLVPKTDFVLALFCFIFVGFCAYIHVHTWTHTHMHTQVEFEHIPHSYILLQCNMLVYSGFCFFPAASQGREGLFGSAVTVHHQGMPRRELKTGRWRQELLLPDLPFLVVQLPFL